MNRDENHYREPILSTDLRLFANSLASFPEGIVEESEETAVKDCSHPSLETSDAVGSDKTAEGAEDLIEVEESEDEGS